LTVIGALRPFFLLKLLLAEGVRHSDSPRKEIDMPIGTVKFFNDQKGFGFIQPDDGTADAFVHISAVERAGWNHLQQDQRLAYDVVVGQRGKSEAANLRTIEDDKAEQDNAPAVATSEEPSEVTAEATSEAPAAD
jgi:CspA family cold shock protein